jgi:hypothetical protein
MRVDQFPPVDDPRPLGRRVSRGRFLRYGLRALLVVVLVLVVAGIALTALILSGPTEFGIIRTRVAAVLEKALPKEYTATVGHAAIDVDPVLGLVLQIDDLSVADGQKAIVASVPATRLALDPLALLGFRVEVRTIELSKANISFVRAADGEVYLGNSATVHRVREKKAQKQAANPPAPDTVVPSVEDAVKAGGASTTAAASAPVAEPDGGFPDLLAAMQILDSGIEPPINEAIRNGFERFSLVNSTIEIWDAPRSQQRRFVDSDLVVSVDPLTAGVSATFATSGYGGRWTATVERNINPRGGSRTMSADFSQLTVADILPGLAEKGRGISADIPLYGRASIDFASNGEIIGANARLDLGAGNIRFGESRDSILLDEATIKLRWDIPNRVLVVDPSSFFFGDTRGVVTGTVRPIGDPKDRRYSYDLISQGAIVAPRDSSEAPLVVQRIAIKGEADLPAKLLKFDNFEIISPEASVAAAGSIGFDGPTPSLALAATLSPMSARALKQLWPAFIAAPARRWSLQNILGGQLVSGQFEASIPAGVLWTGKRLPIPEDQLRLDLRFEDATFTSFGKLPPIEKASGVAVLAGTTFGVDIEKGLIRTASGSTVDIVAGAFAVPNTVDKSAIGRIEIQAAGSAEALGEIADSEPFRALKRRDVTPSDLSGNGTASVSVELPMRAGITPADVNWNVAVKGTGLSSKAPVEGRIFSDANVTINVSQEEFSVTGKAKIDGVVADIDMSQQITSEGASKPGVGQRSVRLVLDDKARKRFGIGLDEVLAGTISALVSNRENGESGQHYELDLRKARVVLPGLGWSKGIGVPATLAFELEQTGSGYNVENIALSGDGFGFTGSAKLSSDYGLVSADISKFYLRKGDSISVKLTRDAGGYSIVARGASLDMRGFLSNLRQAAESSGSAPDLKIDAKIDRVSGFNQEVLSGATISLVTTKGVVRKGSFSGSFGKTPLSLTYTDDSQGAALVATCADAGSVLRFMDIYTRIESGNLRLVGRRNGPSGPLNGTFEIANFLILNEPAMAKVIETRTTGPNPAPTGFRSDRVHFDRMALNFSRNGNVIVIGDALLRGSAMGASFGGRLDLASSRVSITGTYLPAYQLNNLFGKLPIIGLAFGGSQSGGLIGVTFKIDGTMSQPRVFINPLSAVAPGIFRKIFEFQ